MDEETLSESLAQAATALEDLGSIETVADSLGGIEIALESLAHAVALRAIAEYGADEDRELVVAHLKGWFAGKGVFPEE